MTKKRNNDQVILDEIINAKYEEVKDDMCRSEYFELFSAGETLKQYDLTYDDIKYGLVGNGGDGGIDAFYTFLNGELVKGDDLYINKRSNLIELHLIQSKTSPTFKETAILKLKSTSCDILDLSQELDSTESNRYNDELLTLAKQFRNLYRKAAVNFPELKITFHYITTGTTQHQDVKDSAKQLKKTVQELYSNARIGFEFVGASQLLQKYRETVSNRRNLKITESPISTEPGSYICLVALPDYFSFVSDNNALARSIFDSNVRDYQGKVAVNKGIKETLKNPNSDDFWYLNNGVTIISPKATNAGKQLVIEDPQIVNGLQTSYEIYAHFSNISKDEKQNDSRNILVRVICESDEEARDRIIRATNNQTNIPPASLRSSEEVHRNIEDYFKSKDFYYDRKKNYYKNLGKPISKIVGISYLSQAMMSIVLQSPHVARGRPSYILKNESNYNTIFSSDIRVECYLKVLLIMKEVERFLKPYAPERLERKDITNIKFYVAWVTSHLLINRSPNVLAALEKIEKIKQENLEIKKAFDFVWKRFEALGKRDTAAKNQELLNLIKKDINKLKAKNVTKKVRA